jgi:hypothetical protein
MVPSSALVVAVGGERLSCGGFSLSKTIFFGSLEFIIDRFGSLSLSPMGDISDTIIKGLALGGPPSPLRAMMGDMASDGEGRIDHPSPRRCGMEFSPAPATTISWSESIPIAQATETIPPWQATPRSDTNLPIEQWRAQ